MTRISLALFFYAVAALNTIPVAQAQAELELVWNNQKTETLEKLVARYIAPRKRSRPLAESVSISIGTDRGLVASAAFGSAAPGQSAKPSTIYRIGSLTKPFTAFAVLKLIEQGVLDGNRNRVSLETPLADILEDVSHWRTHRGNAITLRDLLTMSSTLPNLTTNPPKSLDPWGAATAARILSALKESRPRRAANTFEYSNTNYFLLAECIDVLLRSNASKATNYQNYLDQAFIKPAGLTHTGFVGATQPVGEYAKPHYRRRPAFVRPDWLKGSADMVGTAPDIYRMNRAIFSGQFLSDRFTRLMLSEINRVSPFEWYGMGWFVRPRDETIDFSHSGSVPGFTAYNRVSQRKADGRWLSITILTNNTEVEGLDVLARDIDRLARGN